MKALVVADGTDIALAEMFGAAGLVASRIDAVAVGRAAASRAEVLAGLGAEEIYVADDPRLDQRLAERWLPRLLDAAGRASPALIVLPHTLLGRELGPLLAFQLGGAMVADCVGLARTDGELLLRKPIYGGLAVADYLALARPVVITPRRGAFAVVAPRAGRSVRATELTSRGSADSSRVRVLEEVVHTPAGRLSLADARRVVAGGRGMGGPEGWDHLEKLAAALEAAVGASGAVVDAGWVRPEMRIGLTGATIAPELYVAVGISGAAQHLAGCAAARTIVAINRDGEAPIFGHARFGVVGDYREILPAFAARVRELRG